MILDARLWLGLYAGFSFTVSVMVRLGLGCWTSPRTGDKRRRQ